MHAWPRLWLPSSAGTSTRGEMKLGMDLAATHVVEHISAGCIAEVHEACLSRLQKVKCTDWAPAQALSQISAHMPACAT